MILDHKLAATILDHPLSQLADLGHLAEFAVIVFSAGGAFFMLRQLRREVSSIWRKFDALAKREQHHNAQAMIALTALAASGNPHGNKAAMAAIQKMSQEPSNG